MKTKLTLLAMVIILAGCTKKTDSPKVTTHNGQGTTATIDNSPAGGLVIALTYTTNDTGNSKGDELKVFVAGVNVFDTIIGQKHDGNTSRGAGTKYTFNVAGVTTATKYDYYLVRWGFTPPHYDTVMVVHN